MKYAKALFLVLLVLHFSCKEKSEKIIETAPPTFTKEGILTITKAIDNEVISFEIEIAETEYEVQTGLMDRDSMKDNQGMLFIFPDVAVHSFYMKNTKIPLDIIYIDENLKIASFAENAKPLDEAGLSSQVPIQYVLEINAGLAEKFLLEIGDKVEFERITN